MGMEAAGEGEHGKKEEKKKKGWQSESEAWGKIKRETCNFDLFYDLWKGRAGEINGRDGTAGNLASSLFGKPV